MAKKAYVDNAGHIVGPHIVQRGNMEWALNKLLLGAGAGADPTEVDVPAAVGVEAVLKTSDETVNNSVALQSDDQLLFAVGANEVWVIELFLRYNSTAVADLKTQMVIPAAAALYLISIANAFGLTVELVNALEGVGTGVMSFDGQGADAYIGRRFYYIGGANAGNIQLQWAQANLEATDTKVLAGSFILAHKLSA